MEVHSDSEMECQYHYFSPNHDLTAAIVRPQGLLRLATGLVGRFWWGLWGWLAHVDPGVARACLARVVARAAGEWVPLSTTRWHAARCRSESNGRHGLLRNGRAADTEGMVALRFRPPAGRLCLRLRYWVALATANGQARERGGDERR